MGQYTLSEPNRPDAALVIKMASMATFDQGKLEDTRYCDYSRVLNTKAAELSDPNVMAITEQDEDGTLTAFIAYGRYPNFLATSFTVMMIQEV